MRKPDNNQARSELDNMFAPESPLGSFSAKIKMAYLLEIIEPVAFKQLKLINNIRREFAHYVSAENPHRKMETLSFKMNKISNMLQQLEVHPEGHVSDKGVNIVVNENRNVSSALSVEANRFVNAVVSIWAVLSIVTEYKGTTVVGQCRG
jgi:hypothetical protein